MSAAARYLNKVKFYFSNVSTSTQVSTVEEEYRPKTNYSSDSDENSDTPAVEEEMSLITAAINYRDKKYVLTPDGHPTNKDSSATDVVATIKRKREQEKNEDR